MENLEIMQKTAAPAPISAEQLALCPPEVVAAIKDMAGNMRALADMLRATNDRIGAMEREVRMLTKVTPAQAAAINTAIRERAAELCGLYRCTGKETATANAIRRAVKLTTGVSSVRELPRCEYSVALEQVKIWEDYKTMKAIRNKGVK